jgi:S-adenosylmethionine:tRNA ribosyltransferase-isomerase
MSESRVWRTQDFDFDLPPELIAQHPAAQRSGSRLLDAANAGLPFDRTFSDLPELLQPGDLLVFNDTRVIKARLLGRKATGGVVEVLVERVTQAISDQAPTYQDLRKAVPTRRIDNTVRMVGEEITTTLGPFCVSPTYEVLAHIRASKSPKAGSVLWLGNEANAFRADVLGRAGIDESLFCLRFPSDPLQLLEKHGHVPLPPYITHADSNDDERRYQTVFAAKPGAIAAPTAALHFDEALLQAIKARGVETAAVTLHVGAGTFQPVRVENLAEHRMHSEWFEVSPETVAAIDQTRKRGGRIIAVGTTTLRALESAALDGDLRPGSRETTIFITPGFPFKVVDQLITNFHLPRSTLMMLVSAFAGYEHVMGLYAHAIRERYRFFSYGDAMWLHSSDISSAPYA